MTRREAKKIGRIQSFWARCRKRAESISLKRKLLITLCTLLFLTPTVGALIYVYTINHIDSQNLFTLTLYDSADEEIVSESGDPADSSRGSLLYIFSSLYSNKNVIPSAPREPAMEDRIRAILSLNGVSSELLCYFHEESGQSYCIDSFGVIYSIEDSLAKNFLSSAYAEVLYDESVPPTLITIDNDTVIPSEVTWNYLNASEHFLPATRPEQTDERLLYEMTGELNLQFSTEPNECKVEVYENEKKIFEGDVDTLPSLTIPAGSTVNIVVVATWNRSDTFHAYGSLRFDFQARIHNRSDFFIDTDTVTSGGFVVLSATNITDLSRVNFTPHTDDAFERPILHRDGEYVRAFLPIAEDTDLDRIAFTVSYGASAKDFEITVLPKQETEQFFYPTHDFSEDEALTGRSQKLFQSLLNNLPQTKNTEIYFRGNFLNPTEDGFHVGYTHGSELCWGEALTESFPSLGTEFVTTASDGAPVKALNHGVVVLLGYTDLLGNYVVVDHGGGLRTWYAHLSDVLVSEGDVVRRGDSLGRTGKSGICTGEGFLILCSIYDYAVDPSYIIGKELRFTQK